MVECQLPKLDVVGSSPISRSKINKLARGKTCTPLRRLSTRHLHYLSFSGSEQESVTPPGFIGFSRFWADGGFGSTVLEVSGRQCSQTFQAAPALSAAADGNCLFRLCRRPPSSDTSGCESEGLPLSARTQADRVQARTGALR